MVLTEAHSMPTEEELTVQEVNLSGPALKAGSFHLGIACEFENNEFILCRQELDDPRACIAEGKAVTNCALNFFRNVKKTCATEFVQYTHCLDKSSMDMSFEPCRNTQTVFDRCMKDNMGIDRPEFGYFCRAKVHDTKRPKPPVEPPAVYPDATPYLPENYPQPPAKHGSRFHWFN